MSSLGGGIVQGGLLKVACSASFPEVNPINPSEIIVFVFRSLAGIYHSALFVISQRFDGTP